MNQLNIHPLCLKVPASKPDSLAALRESMAKGYDDHFPIILYEGMILDGRNRYAIATELGQHPTAEEWKPSYEGDTPEEFVLRAAGRGRRDLSPVQLAALAAELMPTVKIEAKRNLDVNSDTPSLVTSSKRKGQDNSKRSTAKAATAAGVGENSVRVAAKAKATAPEVFKEMQAGTISVAAAAKKMAPPPPPPSLDTVTDAEGHQITDAKAAAAYLERHRFEEIGREIDRVRRMVKELGELPIGVCLDTQRIMTDLHNAKGDILAARPHVQCPHRNCKETCRSCEGRRWITKQLWMATAEEFKK